MAGTYNIRDWAKKAIENTKEDGITRDIHVNDLSLNKTMIKTSPKLEYLLDTFKDLVGTLKDIDTEGIGVFMSVELLGNSSVFQGCPKDIYEIENLIHSDWILSEIIVYKPFKPEVINTVELYRKPVTYLESYPRIDVFYKEFRTYEDILMDNCFIRELNVVYNPNRNGG